jgi:hypothetical protein
MVLRVGDYNIHLVCAVAFAEVLTRVVDGKWIKAKIDCGDKS